MAGEASGMKAQKPFASKSGLPRNHLLDLHIVLSRGVEWVE